jgi:hypothetical protein
MILASFFVLFLLHDVFSKPPIGLAGPRMSFTFGLMPLGFLVFTVSIEPEKLH